MKDSEKNNLNFSQAKMYYTIKKNQFWNLFD